MPAAATGGPMWSQQLGTLPGLGVAMAQDIWLRQLGVHRDQRATCRSGGAAWLVESYKAQWRINR